MRAIFLALLVVGCGDATESMRETSVGEAGTTAVGQAGATTSIPKQVATGGALATGGTTFDSGEAGSAPVALVVAGDAGSLGAEMAGAAGQFSGMTSEAGSTAVGGAATGGSATGGVAVGGVQSGGTSSASVQAGASAMPIGIAGAPGYACPKWVSWEWDSEYSETIGYSSVDGTEGMCGGVSTKLCGVVPCMAIYAVSYANSDSWKTLNQPCTLVATIERDLGRAWCRETGANESAFTQFIPGAGKATQAVWVIEMRSKSTSYCPRCDSVHIDGL